MVAEILINNCMIIRECEGIYHKMVGAFIVEIFMEKIPYLNMYKNQADYNKIT